MTDSETLERDRREREQLELEAAQRLTERFASDTHREPRKEAPYSLPPHEVLEKVAAALTTPVARAPHESSTTVDDDDLRDALILLDRARRSVDAIEFQLLRAARERNMTWKTIAQALDMDSPQAAQQRLGRLERTS